MRPPAKPFTPSITSVAVVAAALAAALVTPWGTARGEPTISTPAHAGLFGLEARGIRVVYVFDRSASMAERDGRPLAVAKRELLRSLDALGENQQFHVIFYNERTSVLPTPGGPGRPLFANDENRQAARRFIDGVRAAGGTRHAPALSAAIALAPDVIFLLTDADAGDDLAEDEFRRLARGLSGIRCMVVQFGAAEGRRSPRLAMLAESSGGDYRAIDVAAAP